MSDEECMKEIGKTEHYAPENENRQELLYCLQPLPEVEKAREKRNTFEETDLQEGMLKI